MRVPVLTQEVVDRAEPAASGSYFIIEGGMRPGSVAGFGVRVHQRSKRYVLRSGGRLYGIGRTDLLSLAEARTRARRKYLEILEGPPPPEALAREKTLWDLARKYMEGVEARVRAGEIRMRTALGYQHLWGRHFERWQELPLAEITVERLETWKAGMADSPIAFNRALQQLNAALRLAVRLKWVPENPCEAVEPFGERPRARVLSEGEVVAWARALAALEAESAVPEEAAAILWALFYSGARPGEILGARAEWITPIVTPGGLLARIALPEAKGDRAGKRERGRVVRVPPPAGAMLLKVVDIDPPSPAALRYAFDKVCARAGIEGATPKVLRHVWRSVAPEAGVDKEHTRQLGGWSSHRVPDSVYSHERNRALDEAAGRIAGRLREVST